ncbi:hypothetical protein SESI111939_03475 [Serratia silvae]
MVSASQLVVWPIAVLWHAANNEKEGAEGNEPLEEPPLALDQINQQSLRLTTMALFLIFASAFYAIGSDLVTVISYLDSVTLWHYSSSVAGKAVLLQAAHENPRVMTDPEPMVFFLNFGASTLDHELRLYVRELRDRSYTVDELNRAIDRLCRENDINIAFNQLEVYLHSQQGNEVLEVKRAQVPGIGNQPAV